MKELTLTMHFFLGTPMTERIEPAHCIQLLATAIQAQDQGAAIERDGKGIITRVACGGFEVELEPRSSVGPCEMEAAS
jgi:hypothetical protein